MSLAREYVFSLLTALTATLTDTFPGKERTTQASMIINYLIVAMNEFDSLRFTLALSAHQFKSEQHYQPVLFVICQ